MKAEPLELRRAVDDDFPAIQELLRSTLGWDDDPRLAALFSWKHRESPFGPSPAWVAMDGERLAGLRVLMRWEWELDGVRQRAVRAVDTATHPDYQGRGIFTRLTRLGIAELADEGVRFVFNTPNEQSRPGYLKMGWRVVGRLPIGVRPISLGGMVRMARARTPAARWSEETNVGVPAPEVLSDTRAVGRLLAARPVTDGLRTATSPDVLAWRYGLPTLNYRVIHLGGGPEEGMAIFRIRGRGEAREAALADVIVPGDEAAARSHLMRRVARSVDADYVIALGATARGIRHFAPLPKMGPILTWRSLAETRMPTLTDWKVGLGDIELF